MTNILTKPVTALSGIGQTRAKAFSRLGIHTLEDLVYHIPRAYEHRGDVKQLKDGLDEQLHAFLLTVASIPKTAILKNRMSITKFKAFDESGSVEVVFFNQTYVKDVFSPGAEFRFWGKLTPSKNKYQLVSPEYESVIPGKVLPDFISVYPSASGLTNKLISSAAAEAVSLALPQIKDPLPDSLRKKNNLPTLATALSCIHRPQNELLLNQAIRRLSYDELLCFALGLRALKKRHSSNTGQKCTDTDVSPFLQSLPYELTNAQKRAISEIAQDMSCADSPSAMSRILIGDVGCGKTVCAAASLYLAVKNGYQAAFMVPTEVLANQHYKDLAPMLSQLGIKCSILLGSTSQKEKKRVYASLTGGDDKIDVIIGTHALLNDNIKFENLGLIITDEQHRFGANQRSLLKERNKNAHTLVMSATPIPRTLALTLYGDLSVSIIDEMPKGRSRVDTFAVDETYRPRLNAFISKLVADGGQIYIVCPAIEDSQEDSPHEKTLEDIIRKHSAETSSKLKNIVDYTASLKSQLPDLRIEFLHGKMKSAQKDEIMKSFSEGCIDVLVSTTVIEVGVNVPNACLMIVENAERFGLSQLHQLRGRVGRGTRKSYCVLVSDSKGANAKERLNIMKNSYDGYKIAECDLQMRGPGDFFASAASDSIRQSGGLSLRFSSLYSDEELLKTAFEDASQIIAQDPFLNSAENSLLVEKITKMFTINENTLN